VREEESTTKRTAIKKIGTTRTSGELRRRGSFTPYIPAALIRCREVA